jgi:hypothetical protein
MQRTVEYDRGPRSLLLDLADLDLEARKNVLRVLKEHEVREALLRAEVSRLKDELTLLGGRTPLGDSSHPSSSSAQERRP